MHSKTKVPETTLNQFRCQMVLFNGESFFFVLPSPPRHRHRSNKSGAKKKENPYRKGKNKLEGDDDEKDTRDVAARFFFVPVPGAYDLDFVPQDLGRAVAITTSTPS